MEHRLVKNVAIIGCSFSDSAYAPYTWAYKLAKKYPKIKFSNYSKGGMGHLYMDMCLKHALYVESYDYIIIQCTSAMRWHYPLDNVSFDDGPADINPYESFTRQTTDNYTRMAINERVQQLIVLENPTPADRVEDETTFRKKPFRTSYHGLWLKQLDSISKVHNISYFSFPELKYTTNNIGQKYDVWDWFEKEYGPRKVVEEMLDDTNHLNEYGNNLLLENYILQSNIKDCLTLLS